MQLDPFHTVISERGYALIDGGGASELERAGYSLGDRLWASSAYLDAPELIAQVHRSYLAAGVDCITTMTYQASFAALEQRGLSPQECWHFFGNAVALAVSERDRSARVRGRRALVAASLGPYGAYLADGSEYHGSYRVTRDALADFHRPRIEAASAAGADVLAFETVPSLAELEVLTDILGTAVSSPCWISLSVGTGDSLADGTPLDRAVAVASAPKSVVAVGFNCLAPVRVTPLVELARRKLRARWIVVYPNAGETYVADSGEWNGARQSLAESAPAWWDAGARLIGGCCRTTPSDIARLARALDEHVARRQNSG